MVKYTTAVHSVAAAKKAKQKKQRKKLTNALWWYIRYGTMMPYVRHQQLQQKNEIDGTTVVIVAVLADDGDDRRHF